MMKNHYNSIQFFFVIFFPSARSIIDSWIRISAELFNDAIKYDMIPITYMPAVQQTALMKSIDEKCQEFIDQLKRERQCLLHTKN